MDRDFLERLATDRVLGALTPDVQTLFDSYLQLDPQAAAASAEIGQTVGLARHALAEKTPSSMPAFPTAGFLQIERWRRRMARLTYAAGLAACLSIGLGLGRMTAPTNPPRAIMVRGPASEPPTFVEKNGNSSETPDRSSFWSVERIRQQREQTQVSVSSPAIRKFELPWLGWQRPA